MINFLTGILATWRIASLFHREDGPFEVFGKLRDLAGVRYDEMSMPVSENQIGKMFCCFWCASFWAGLGASCLQGDVSLIKALGYSAGAIFLEELRKCIPTK